MKNCKRVKQRIHVYLDGGLSNAERAEIEGHLGECPACRRELAQARRLWSALDAWPAPKASEGFNRRFWRRVRQEQGRAPVRRRWPVLVWSPVFAVAAAAILMLAIVLFGGTPEPPSAPGGAVFVQVMDQLDQAAVLRDENLVDYIGAFEVLGLLEPEDWSALSGGKPL